MFGFCVFYMYLIVVFFIYICWVMRRCVFCGVSCFFFEWILRGVVIFMFEWVWRRVWVGMFGWVCCRVRIFVFEGFLWSVRFIRVVGLGVLSFGGLGRLIYRYWGGRRGWFVFFFDMKIYSIKIIKKFGLVGIVI